MALFDLKNMVDLHVHSTASDGTDSPAANVRKAKSLGLHAIAISDHDSVEGVDEAIREGRAVGIEVVPAVEMSSQVDDWDTHFLGYFIDHHGEKLRRTIKRLRDARWNRAVAMVQKLNQLGVPLEFPDVAEEAGSGAIGRAHIARVLVAKGFVRDIPKAFSKYLSRGRPAYVEKSVLTPREIIDLIHETGGVAVLAHPALSRCNNRLDEFIAYGLDGIEAYHTEHSERQRTYYKKLADMKGLIATGGSDCHGLKSTHGATLGTVAVPDFVLDDLRKRAKRVNESSEGTYHG